MNMNIRLFKEAHHSQYKSTIDALHLMTKIHKQIRHMHNTNILLLL